MQRSVIWIATAALSITFLGGCAAQRGISDRSAPQGMSGSTGEGISSSEASPVAGSPRGRLDTILQAPSAFSCRGEGATEDVFEEQCESETRTGD